MHQEPTVRLVFKTAIDQILPLILIDLVDSLLRTEKYAQQNRPQTVKLVLLPDLVPAQSTVILTLLITHQFLDQFRTTIQELVAILTSETLVLELKISLTYPEVEQLVLLH